MALVVAGLLIIAIIASSTEPSFYSRRCACESPQKVNGSTQGNLLKGPQLQVSTIFAARVRRIVF